MLSVGYGLPSNLTDEEWALIEPLLPARSQLGRPAKWTYRQIVNGLFYVLRGCLPWRMLPRGPFPPMTTVPHYFYAWRDSGLWQSLNHYLLMEVREACGKEASPTAGVIDSQSVKTTDPKGGAAQVAVSVGLTQARRSRAASDTSSLTPMVFWLEPSFTGPMFKTATAHHLCWRPSESPSRGCAISLQTAAMPERNCAPP